MVDILDKYKQYDSLALTNWMSAINFCTSCKYRIVVDNHFCTRFVRFVLCFVARDLSSLSKETLEERNTVISSDLIPAVDLEAFSNIFFQAIESFLENKNFEKVYHALFFFWEKVYHALHNCYSVELMIFLC